MLRKNWAFVVGVLLLLAGVCFIGSRITSVSENVPTFAIEASTLLFSVTTATLVFFVDLAEKRFERIGTLQNRLSGFPNAGQGLRTAYLRLLFSQVLLSFAAVSSLTTLILGAAFVMVATPPQPVVLAMLLNLGLYALWLVDFAFFSNLPLGDTYQAYFGEARPNAPKPANNSKCPEAKPQSQSPVAPRGDHTAAPEKAIQKPVSEKGPEPPRFG